MGPTTRCGTSLLQRLLNSTGKVVIHGEHFSPMPLLPKLLPEARYG